MSCGLLKWNNPESNLLEKIVVASGGFSNSIDQTSVELLYLNEEDVSQGVHFTNMLQQLFCTKVFFEAFLCLQFGIINFWQKNNSTKAAHKMLVKLTQGEWVMGPPMPVSAPYSTMVEYNNSVILIGGVDRRHLYKLSSPTEDWIEMRQTLKYKSTKHVSFLVPDEILNCHRKGIFIAD